MTARSFTFTADLDGPHARVTVRCGQEGSRALLGHLKMRSDEWVALRARLAPDVTIDRVVFDASVEAAGAHVEAAKLAAVNTTVEEKLRALVRAENALAAYPSTYFCLFSASDEVIAYANRHGVWKENSSGSAYGDSEFELDVDGNRCRFAVRMRRDRVVPREAPPRPACAKCGSTAAPDACPCGSSVPEPVVDDVEIPF